VGSGGLSPKIKNVKYAGGSFQRQYFGGLYKPGDFGGTCGSPVSPTPSTSEILAVGPPVDTDPAVYSIGRCGQNTKVNSYQMLVAWRTECSI
jgi:hypothetical protein